MTRKSNNLELSLVEYDHLEENDANNNSDSDKDEDGIFVKMFDNESDEVHVDPDELHQSERKYVQIGVVISIILVITSLLGAIWPDTFDFFKFPTTGGFWMTLLPSPLAVYGLFFVFAYPNVYHQVRANITRKGTHLTVQIVVFIGFFVIDNEDDLEEVCAQFFWIAFYTYWSNIVFMDFFRQKVSFFRFAFRAVDRKEDRPHTLLWNSTQTTLMIGLNATITAYVSGENKSLFGLIPIIIIGLGDGLAEPVGIFYGKHKYKTTALFSKKLFTRSYEGSACVFFFTALACCIAYPHYDNDSQFVFMLLVLPLAETLAEAKAPHTFDGPFMQIVFIIALAIMLQIGDTDDDR